MFEVTHVSLVATLLCLHCIKILLQGEKQFQSFTKELEYIHLILATLQSVVTATNNLALLDCFRPGISTQ